MPCVPRMPRAALMALGLSLFLLADGLTLLPGGTAHAADDGYAPTAGAVGDAEACDEGFTDVSTRVEMSLHGVTLVPRGAIAVGYSRRRLPGHNGVRTPAALINRGSDWTRVPVIGPGEEDGLMAVATSRTTDTWAVGFTTIGPDVKPLAMRWDGQSWTVDRPRVGGSVAVLTDVAIVDGRSPFAVGYRMAPDGKRKPLVLRKDGPRWRSVPMSARARESFSLTGTAIDRSGGTWVVGHGGEGAEVKPLIFRRDRGKWQRLPVPPIKGEAVLTDIVSTGRKQAWAVGYQRRDGNAKPLVLRWNGSDWRRAKAPTFHSTDVLLSAISADPSGGVWVVGAAWDDEVKDYQAVTARWKGKRWREHSGRTGGTELNDAVGALDGRGWAVGRSNGSGRVVRVCAPPPADPSHDADTLPDETGLDDPDEGPAQDGTDANGADEDAESFDADDLEAYDEEQMQRNRRNGRKAKFGASRIGTLPVATPDKRIVARDVAKPAGVFEETGTYDAVIEDFDGDGIDDIFIGRHGRKGRLLLNQGGVFVDHWVLDMPAIDRHGCTAADVDGSGLPDLYCAVGGKRGSGLKSNELWLDPGGPAPVEVASASGVADPTGRGRLTAFLEAKRHKAADLIVTNSPTRVDGLPSLARLIHANGEGGFNTRAQAGIASRLGAQAIGEADFDGDGREDLVLVTGGPQAPQPAGTRLYRNTRTGLVDVTRKMGIRGFDEQDAELVDLNKDGLLDLVQLSEIKLKVSLQKKGRFKKVFERNLSDGRAIAAGDVNGDKRADLYLMRSGSRGNTPDVVLLNRRDGRDWSSVIVPQVTGGGGDDAYAIDHDGNGLDDFLVLNGHNGRGPTQLIAFYRR